MANVIFVCTGNICRSPMAEGILKARADSLSRLDLQVTSMGTHGLENEPAAEFAVQVCDENGIDIRVHRARTMVGREVQAADYIFCMERQHCEYVQTFFPWQRDRVHHLGAWPGRVNWRSNIKDPYTRPIAAYRKAFEKIDQHIDRILQRI